MYVSASCSVGGVVVVVAVLVSAAHDQVELFAGEQGRLVDDDFITELCDDFFGKFEAQFLVCQFTPAVDDSQFDFVAGLEEVGDFAELDLQVVLPDLESEAHLFYLEYLGILLVALHLLGLLVAVFAPVDYFDYRWFGVGGDLY